MFLFHFSFSMKIWLQFCILIFIQICVCLSSFRIIKGSILKKNNELSFFFLKRVVYYKKSDKAFLFHDGRVLIKRSKEFLFSNYSKKNSKKKEITKKSQCRRLFLCAFPSAFSGTPKSCFQSFKRTIFDKYREFGFSGAFDLSLSLTQRQYRIIFCLTNLISRGNVHCKANFPALSSEIPLGVSFSLSSTSYSLSNFPLTSYSTSNSSSRNSTDSLHATPNSNSSHSVSSKEVRGKEDQKQKIDAQIPKGKLTFHSEKDILSSVVEKSHYDSSNELSQMKINWYPSYMNKCLFEFNQFGKFGDIFIEFVDARIPNASQSSRLINFVEKFKNKKYILVFTHIDLASELGNEEWGKYYRIKHAEEKSNRRVVFLDAKHGGKGVIILKKQIDDLSASIVRRRKNRGLLSRPIRLIFLGSPNVGKSATINRLFNRKKCRSFDMPGVTRLFRWVRYADERERKNAVHSNVSILDTPGISPNFNKDQDTAYLHAVCNLISASSYEAYDAAVFLIERMFKMWKENEKFISMQTLKMRYAFDPLYFGENAPEFSGEYFMAELTRRRFVGDTYASACRVLTDFRQGKLGRITLEKPPFIPKAKKVGKKNEGLQKQLTMNKPQTTFNNTCNDNNNVIMFRASLRNPPEKRSCDLNKKKFSFSDPNFLANCENFDFW